MFVSSLWILVTLNQKINTNSNQNHFIVTGTCALVSEIIESVLQTVQKQFTYRQYKT